MNELPAYLQLGAKSGTEAEAEARMPAEAYLERVAMLVRLGMLDEVHRSRIARDRPGVEEVAQDIRELEAMTELTPD